MEYLPEQPEAVVSHILCCECGTAIEPNPANMCVACLRTRVDITEGIPKTGVLHFCRNCERYLQPPNTWVSAQLESRELLAICLKKVQALKKEVRLVDAGFIWTEPHSKRLKVQLSIQKEVVGGAVLQQVFIVEFTVHNQMCDDCHRVEAKDYWRAVTQIRQKTNHKKTLYFLEQQIIKFKAHVNTTSIKPVHEGLDFYYAQKQDAKRLVDFLQTVVPMRYQTAQELISHDVRSNIFNYKFTFSVEIVPICKDNIVCLPAKLAQSLGNMGQVCVVYRVTQTVHVIDPQTCQIAEIAGPVYWRHPFLALNHPRQLVEFIVMDVEIIYDKDKRHVAGAARVSQKHVLADVYVVKASEIGQDDRQFHCRTHLGHLLQPGDSVMGLDLTNANVNDNNLEKMKSENVPDVVLVKKQYGDANKRMKKRKWKLQRLEGEAAETASMERDYNDFLEDLEEDPDYRAHVNIYKDAAKLAVDPDDDTSSEDGGAPRITLAEMLDDLQIAEDATGGEGADMME